MVILSTNDEPARVDADPSTPLLWALRDDLGLTDTKFGCGVASCDAYTVHLNGQPTRSCVLPIFAVTDQQIATSEYTVDDKVGKAMSDAWVKHDTAQCSYCQSGQMMSVAGLLCTKEEPTNADIDNAMVGNLCRCATHQRVRVAVYGTAKSLA